MIDSCKRIINYSARNAIYLPEIQQDTMNIATAKFYSNFPNLLRRHIHFVSCSSMNVQLLTRESYRFDSQLDIFVQDYIASLKIILWYKTIKMSLKLKALVASGSSWFGKGPRRVK